MRSLSLRSRLIVAGLAATGVVVAHAFAYFVTDSHPHSRMELLLSTGHESFGVVVAAALGALAAGFVRFVSQFGTSNHSRNGVDRIYKRDALRLSILQLVGFTALEAAERQLAGLSPVGILAEPAFLIGLITQIIVALLGAALLVLLAKACERLFSRRGLSPIGAATLHIEPHLDSVLSRFKTATGSGTLRGPPVAF
jgi:hypothetical protein